MIDSAKILHQPTRIFRRHTTPTRFGHLSLIRFALGFTLFSDFVHEMRGHNELALIGSYHLNAVDLAAALCLLAVLWSRPSISGLDGRKIFVLIIAAVLGLTIVRGILQDPFQAFYALRPSSVALLFLFYASFSNKELQPIANYHSWIVAGVIAFTLLFILRTAFGPTLFLDQGSFVADHIVSLELRAIGGFPVVFLGAAAVLFLDTFLSKPEARSRRLYLALVIASVVVIFLSRQRSATAACLIGFVTLFLADGKFLRRNVAIIVAIAVCGLAAIIIWATDSIPELVQVLPDEFQESFQKTSTLDARQQVWASALGSRFVDWDIVRQLFGAPSGEPLFIVTAAGRWKNSLHSQYVATIMNYGIVGTLMWILLIVVTIIRAVRGLVGGEPNRAGLAPRVVLAWLAILLVYGINYEWQNSCGFIAAMAVAGWSRHSNWRTTAISPSWLQRNSTFGNR